MKTSRNWFVAFLLLGILLFCFARTLGSYFLEDDIGEVSYVSKIVAGNLSLLVSNFTGNYMQIPAMQVYRPWLLLSLLFDFIFWRTNAFGYYLTNIAFMYGCGLMLYAVLRRLTSTWGRLRSFWASSIGAALFLANPLHSEAVSIVVGRVDIICCFFYLVSLWCYLKRGIKGKPFLLVAGTVAFWLAILTKEMAICLPVLLAGIGLIMPEIVSKATYEEESLADETRHFSLVDRIDIALRLSLPLWISTIVYFIIRFLALGTLVGGYVGSIGAGQNAHLIERWKDIDTLHRVLYPMNFQVFGATSVYHTALHVMYFLIGALLLSRWVSKGLPWRWLFFLAFWSGTTVLPIYQLWGLSENLDGSRFLFFLTMPLACLLPICLLAPAPTEAFSRVNFKLEIASLFCLFILVLVDCKIAYRNNIPWIHAGKQMQACSKQAQLLANRIGKDKRAILLGLPTEREGARMILNGVTFNMLLSAPFTKKSFCDQFLLFAPIIYGNDELINMQRYKECIRDPAVVGTYVWNYDSLQFDPVSVPDPNSISPAAEVVTVQPQPSVVGIYPYARGQPDWEVEPDGAIAMTGGKLGTSIAIAPLKINPFQYDFVQFDLKREPCANKTDSSAFWQGKRDVAWQDSYRPLTVLLPAHSGKDFQTVRMPISRHWRWFTAGDIVKLRLDLPVAQSLKVKNVKIVSAGNLVPDLEIEKLRPDNTGVYTASAEPLNFLMDGASVPGCQSVKIELSKANFFFENLPESMVSISSKSNISETVLKAFVCQGVLTRLTLPHTAFPSLGYYQLRAICLDKDGRAVGERSDPLTLLKTNL